MIIQDQPELKSEVTIFIYGEYSRVEIAHWWPKELVNIATAVSGFGQASLIIS